MTLIMIAMDPDHELHALLYIYIYHITEIINNIKYIQIPYSS